MASYTENFAGLGNENPLSQGGVWTSFTGGGLKILSGKAIGTGTASSSVLTTPTFAADHTVEITLATVGSFDNPGIILRQNSGVAYAFVYFNSASELRFYKVSGGTTYNLQGTLTTFTLAGSDVLSAGVVTNGANADFTVKKNGSTVWSPSDTTSVITSGAPGAYHENGNVGASGITLFYAYDGAGGGGGPRIADVGMILQVRKSRLG